MRVGGPDIIVPKEGMLKGLYLIKLPAQLVSATKTMVQVGVYEKKKKIFSSKIKFIGPLKKKL